MQNERDLVDNVSDVHTHNIEGARRKFRPTNGKQGNLHGPEAPPDDNAFPYLEQIIVAAKQHPYTMLALMISVAGIVIAAIVTVSVALFTGVFLMYGTMRDVQAKQEVIMEQQSETREQVNLVKTVYMTTLARQDVMLSLMSKESQQQMQAFDRANPRQIFPETKQENKQ